MNEFKQSSSKHNNNKMPRHMVIQWLQDDMKVVHTTVVLNAAFNVDCLLIFLVKI